MKTRATLWKCCCVCHYYYYYYYYCYYSTLSKKAGHPLAPNWKTLLIKEHYFLVTLATRCALNNSFIKTSPLDLSRSLTFSSRILIFLFYKNESIIWNRHPYSISLGRQNWLFKKTMLVFLAQLMIMQQLSNQYKTSNHTATLPGRSLCWYLIKCKHICKKQEKENTWLCKMISTTNLLQKLDLGLQRTQVQALHPLLDTH